MAKIKIPTAEEIEAKKEALKTKIATSKENAKNGRISPTQNFLNQVKDLIDDAIKSGVSFAQISKDIYEVYSFKVSAQTIRVFAQNHLGLEKKSRNKKAEKTTPKSKPEKEASNDRKKSDFNDI